MLIKNAVVRQYYPNCSNEIVGLFIKSGSIRGRFIGNITDVDIATRVLPWTNKMVVLSLLPPVEIDLSAIIGSHKYSIMVTGLVANGGWRWLLEVYGTIHCIACDEYFD